MEFTFEGNHVLDTVDAVPENLRVFYTQNEETKKWELVSSAEGKAAIAIITGHQSALKAARAENKTLKDRVVDLSPLGAYGTTVEEIIAGVDKVVSDAKGAVGQDVDRQVGKIKEDLATEYKKTGDASQKRIEALEKQLFTIMGTGAAKAVLKDVAVDVDLAMPFVTQQLKTVEENGEFGVRVVDGQGDVRFSGTTGAPMTVSELVANMRTNTKFAPLFKSETPQGGGAKPGATVTTPPKPGDAEKSPTEKIAAGLAKKK